MKTDRIITESTILPFSDAELFEFRGSVNVMKKKNLKIYIF